MMGEISDAICHVVGILEIMDGQVETQKIPWYRTRLLWGVVIGVLATINLILFFPVVKASQSFLDLIFNLLTTQGGGLIWVPLSMFLGDSTLVGISSALLFLILLLLLFYKTFSNLRVKVVFPAIVVTVQILNIILIYLVLSSI